jgi:restriction endonuclease
VRQVNKNSRRATEETKILDFEPFPHDNHFIDAVAASAFKLKTFSSHSSFNCQQRKMFGRAVKNIVRQELLGKGHQKHQKIITRAILTSNSSFYKHNLADNQNDVIVYSTLPSINYPDCSIDQYVWSNFNKWGSKTALVSRILIRIRFGALTRSVKS